MTFDDLEYIATPDVRIDSKRGAQGVRNFRRSLDVRVMRSIDSMCRRNWLDETRRVSPTLPRVKWLERPDP